MSERRNSETWLIGVSGGPDSMALLSMCLEEGVPVAAAHVNYHHRPEADQEEEYVRTFCAEHGIACYVRDEPFVYSGNFEAAARKWRYDFFGETVKKNGYCGIMIAHQEDDLLETYLMQSEKKLEPDYFGLRSDMMYQGVLVRRPLLSYTKAQLQAYCDSHQIRYFIDATNQDETYARNRIRHEVVEKLTPMERKMLRGEIDQQNAVLQERRCRVNAWAAQSEFPLSAYRSLGEEDRIALLRAMIPGGNHLRRRHLMEVDVILLKHDDFVISLGAQQMVQSDGRFFCMDVPSLYSCSFSSLDEMQCGSVYEWFRISRGKPGVNAITFHSSDFPVTIRNAMPGDAISMCFGTKKVNRWMIDRKIPKWKRNVWPVVVNHQGTVILVPGIGCDVDHYSLAPDLNIVAGKRDGQWSQ